MDFKENRPIYLQIIETFEEKIVAGELLPDDRIMSVRELGSTLGVNPNTVMRCYERMTSDGIIYIKRGLGYYVSEQAKEIIQERMRREFLTHELPKVIAKAKLLNVNLKEYLE